jgi:type II secretory pathway component PulF
MEEFLHNFFDWSKELSGYVFVALVKILLPLLSAGIALGVLALIIYAAWATLSAGLKRQERAHCFLRLLELGVGQGRSVEETIASLARARVRDMGVFFHLVAAWMERGCRLGGALQEAPGFLPRQVAAMIRVGESVGQLERVFPLCRASLGSGPAESRKQLNNLAVLLFVSPIGPVVLWMIAIFILPKFRAIWDDMGIQAPFYVETCFKIGYALASITALLWLGLWILESSRGGGGRLIRMLFPGSGGLLDWLELRLPWKRKRIQRDFSAMLAALLDTGVPEAKAIELAAEATANRRFQRRAERAVHSLREGVSLAGALQKLDGSGEFRWRLQNATPSGRGFSQALSGWIESLDARAFQQEQFFSQLVSTGFVLLNGVMVGLTAISIFRFLIITIDSIAW